MNVGLYQSVSGLKAYWAQQQTIAENLSRATIPGNRQRVTAFMSVEAAGGSGIGTAAKVGKPASENVAVVPSITTHTGIDFSQGALEPTSDPLNLAIEGAGFFTIREKSGAISYTRDGSFRWNTDGRVTTQDGAELLGAANQPISVSTTKGLLIDEAGTVSIDGISSGQVALTHFNDPMNDLKQGVNGRFTKNDGVKEVAQNGAIKDTIRSGYLERSNSDPITQMVSMIDVMRAYEANQKMLMATDEASAKLIKATGT